jgi:hypothetical protein
MVVVHGGCPWWLWSKGSLADGNIINNMDVDVVVEVDVPGKYVDKTNLNTGGQPMLGGERKEEEWGVRGGIYSQRSKGPTRPFGFLSDTRR